MATTDFIIENGVLKKYIGAGGDVIIPTGVSEIAEDAFGCCENLISVTFPDGLEKIGAEAFVMCRDLSDIKNLRNIKELGNAAFWGCHQLADEKGFVIVKDVLFQYVGTEVDITIPEDITIISQGAFADCDITSVILPNGLKRISDSAFDGCEYLSSIEIPNSVKEIGAAAFLHCKKLADKEGFVIMNNTLYDYVGENPDVVIPTEIVAISEYAFIRAEDFLKSIFIPQTVKKIDDDMFSTFFEEDGIGNITICGYIGSCAEQFAKEKNIPFVAE